MQRVYPPFGVPSAAQIVSGCNQAPAVTAATPVAVLAAPAVATQRYYITKAKYVNPTTAEHAAATVIETASAVILFAIEAEDLNTTIATPPSGPSNGEIEFDPPIVVAAGQGVSVNPVTTLGDSYLTLVGYMG